MYTYYFCKKCAKFIGTEEKGKHNKTKDILCGDCHNALRSIVAIDPKSLLEKN